MLDTPNLPTMGLSKTSVDIRIRMLLSGVIDAYKAWLSGEIDCTLEELSAEVAMIAHTMSKK